MKKQIFLFFVLFIFLATAVTAAPPFLDTQTETNEGLQIAYPKFQYFKHGVDLELYFHVHDSNSTILTDSTTECLFHLYNQSEHIIEDSMSFYSPIDFEYDLGNTRDVGVYTYLVYCNNTDEAGFVSGGFEITQSGKAIENDYQVISVIIIIPLIFSLLLILASLGLGEEHGALKLFMGFFSWIGFWVSSHFGTLALVEFYEFTSLQDIIGSTVYWSGWIFFAVISYWFIYLIYIIFYNIKSKKEKELNY